MHSNVGYSTAHLGKKNLYCEKQFKQSFKVMNSDFKMQEPISTMNSTGTTALSTQLKCIIYVYTLQMFHFEAKLQSG